jgi:uncharacterized protein YjiS (DUF1127 family)
MKILDSIKETISKNIREAQTKRELSRLSDRELADIGISRGNIKYIVKENKRKA